VSDERLRVSVVIPAYNESTHIVPVLDRLIEAVNLPCEVLVVVDTPDDTTIPVVEKYAANDHPTVRVVVNDFGRGPARLVERGVVVAAASRYMPGGQQVGGPYFKRVLSKNAGRSLHWFARIGTRDATNSFKAYNREFVEQVGIDSRDGFEIGLELTAKARRMRLPVAEIPTIWLDRPAGVSNFRLTKWIPKYLRWYRFAFGSQLDAAGVREATQAYAGTSSQDSGEKQ
jgi:dolichol-phosphate mannosyltransferase